MRGNVPLLSYTSCKLLRALGLKERETKSGGTCGLLNTALKWEAGDLTSVPGLAAGCQKALCLPELLLPILHFAHLRGRDLQDRDGLPLKFVDNTWHIVS